MSKTRDKTVCARVKRFLFRALLFITLFPAVVICITKYVNPPYWGWRMARLIDPPSEYPTHVKHQWVSIRAISPNMTNAVMASEDQRFPQHWGVDFTELKNAVFDAVNGDGLRGASTITQQTAKNVFLFPSHSLLRKGYELYLSFLLELIWGKERIIEVYLNVIEFGPGIYGVGAASRYYYHIPPSKLTRKQAAQLAVVLPNPYKMNPTQRTEYQINRTAWVERQMKNLGRIKFE